MKPAATDLAELLQSFLTHYLPIERNASPNTISGYRYAFVLLLRYCQQVRKLPLERLRLQQVDAPLVVDFLDHIEKKRGVGSSTRNHRLAAVHSFFRYVQTQSPEHVALCQRVLAIPLRRVVRADPISLAPPALAALLNQPDQSTRKGRRDVVLLSVLYDTGARVQELIDLRVRDVRVGTSAIVQLTGKG